MGMLLSCVFVTTGSLGRLLGSSRQYIRASAGKEANGECRTENSECGNAGRGPDSERDTIMSKSRRPDSNRRRTAHETRLETAPVHPAKKVPPAGLEPANLWV